MINYKSRSIYFDITNGEEISKQNALKNYTKLKTKKHVNRREISEHNGYEFGTITIEWWHECEPKRQLTLFNKTDRRDTTSAST